MCFRYFSIIMVKEVSVANWKKVKKDFIFGIEKLVQAERDCGFVGRRGVGL